MNLHVTHISEVKCDLISHALFAGRRTLSSYFTSDISYCLRDTTLDISLLSMHPFQFYILKASYLNLDTKQQALTLL